MDILNTKIKAILTEKTTKIIPENIKSGVNILGINGSVVELKGEVKTVNPTTNQQIIIPTSTGKNALTQVTVNAVTNTIDNNIVEGNIKSGVSILGVQGSSKVLDTTDSNATAGDIVTGKTAFVNGQKITGNYTGIIPTGTKNIIENGVSDITNYASVDVNVPAPLPNLQSKSIEITENTTQTISADSGYDGLNGVEITTNVSGGGGDITHEEYLQDVELARSILEDFIRYNELQYIESTGTQYFDTEYYPNQNTKIEMIVETLNLTSTFVPFGTRESSRLDYIAGINFNNQNYIQFNTNTAEYFGNSNNFLNAKIKVILYNGYFKVEYIGDSTKNIEGTFATRDNFQCLTSLYLGCLNNNGSTRYLDQKYRIFSTKIFENDVLIKDYIPVLDRFNDKACLYDKINESYLYNSGTGNMIAGGVV